MPLPTTPTFEKQIRILGLPVSAITYAEWLDLIDQWVQSGQPHHVCTINPEMIMIARQDVNFHNILSRADLTVPDGVGLLWAARQIGQPLPQRVTGSDGVPIIAAEAAHRGWRIYLLGAAPGVADQAAAVLRQRHPTLQIVGTYSGSPAARRGRRHRRADQRRRRRHPVRRLRRAGAGQVDRAESAPLAG